MQVDKTCRECGLLQILKADTREFVAVEQNIRETSTLPTNPVHGLGQVRIYKRVIECFAGKAIRAELESRLHDFDGSWRKAFQDVVSQPRPDCDGAFMQLQPGLSPKEHREMKLLAEVERRTNKWRDDDIERQDKFDKRNERRHTTTLITQFLLALLAVVVTLLAAKLLPFFGG